MSMKKKILILTPYYPFPANDGGKVRLYNLIKQLSARNDVYLLSFVDSLRTRMYLPPMEQFCKKIFLVKRDELPGIGGDDLPRCVSGFYTADMVEKLLKVLAEVKPDVIDINFLIMTRYADHVHGIPVVFTEHDISNINFEKSIHDRDLPENERYKEWVKLVQYERTILPKFAGVVVVSESDRSMVREFNDQLRPVLIPTGVDLNYFQSSTDTIARTENTLLYVGNYRHYPNFAAMRYFVKRIFPLIVSERPETRLYIVGPGMPSDSEISSNERVVITGEVEDVRKYLRAASVFVAPIRLGGGIKGKILEAMASGVPVVATEEAGQGINCHPGEEIVIASDAADFAAKTVKLLDDVGARRLLAHNARRLVEEHYDWMKIAGQLDSYLDSLCFARMGRQ